MLNLRISFNVMYILILLVCIWFFYATMKVKIRYQKVFRGIMWVSVVLYLNHIIGIVMEETCPEQDFNRILQQSGHYFLSAAVYVLYALFMNSFVKQFQYYPKWRKALFYAPSVLLSILLFTTPWTHLIFYYEQGQYHVGPLFPFMIMVRALYALGGTVEGYRKRKLYPDIFGQSILVIAFFSLLQMVIFVLFRDESLYYSALIVDVILCLLTMTFVEFYKDSQTGLLNDAAFWKYVNYGIKQKSNREVYLIKLKNYQYVKENCHAIPLQMAIQEMAECIKEYSMLPSVYYLGSGRFSIVVQKHAKFSQEKFIEKMKERFCVPFDVNGASISFKIFIAIMNLERGRIDKNNFSRYFSACDDMKSRSIENVEVIQGDSFGIDQIQRYHSVEEAIDRALAENSFHMFYQPIIQAKTGKVISAEGLLRLNDRLLGYISPEEFIPISENNGKILDISEFVIDSVFRFVKEHNLEEMGIEFIEMNLSMIQCMDGKLPDKLRKYLNIYQIKPSFINLEITETATNFDEERLKEQFIKMRNMGFTISIDDYGTGYSNLVRVLEYPINCIKLDKSIVWSAFHNGDNFVTLKNLIAMFHDVNKKVVAEGVESAEQMDALTGLDCDYLQGYYYSKPINEDEFIRFVSKYNSLIV